MTNTMTVICVQQTKFLHIEQRTGEVRQQRQLIGLHMTADQARVNFYQLMADAAVLVKAGMVMFLEKEWGQCC